MISELFYFRNVNGSVGYNEIHKKRKRKPFEKHLAPTLLI